MSFTYFDSEGNEQYAEVRFTDAACREHPYDEPMTRPPARAVTPRA